MAPAISSTPSSPRSGAIGGAIVTGVATATGRIAVVGGIVIRAGAGTDIGAHATLGVPAPAIGDRAMVTTGPTGLGAMAIIAPITARMRITGRASASASGAVRA